MIFQFDDYDTTIKWFFKRKFISFSSVNSLIVKIELNDTSRSGVIMIRVERFVKRRGLLHCCEPDSDEWNSDRRSPFWLLLNVDSICVMCKRCAESRKVKDPICFLTSRRDYRDVSSRWSETQADASGRKRTQRPTFASSAARRFRFYTGCFSIGFENEPNKTWNARFFLTKFGKNKKGNGRFTISPVF